ncbi:MAG: sodium/solute symporter [Acidobacteria bacterium]|nr:sodium/solute symporter [Acidobacteriota bacterium]
MTTLDSLILAVYLAAVVVVGALCSRNQKSLSDFFLGQRNIPWWAAAFSGIATVLSAVSFLGAPGQAFKSDLRFLQYRLGTPIAIFVIGWIMIPFFYRLRVFSIYEYLEQRFDLKTRLAASGQFFLLKALFLGVAIYAPSLLFVQMTGLPLHWVVLFVGLFTTIYTATGGVKAVIWTDTLQLFILFGGLATAASVILSRAGGYEHVFADAAANGKLRFLDFSWSLDAEFTVLGGIFGGTFVLLSQYGVNQAELQKMLTTSSIGRARTALISSMLVATVVGFVYFLIGAGLFVFYAQHPETGAAGLNPDRIFPKFILEELPPGIKGLMMAAVGSAAMSASSSVLNALSTVVTTDFYGRLSGRAASVTSARAITLALGVTCTVAALYVDRLGNILVAATKLQNFFGGSLTGAFLLGMTIRSANGSGAFCGVVLGTAGVTVLSLTTDISWVWHGLFAAAIAFGGGALLSRLFTTTKPAPANLIWRV